MKNTLVTICFLLTCFYRLSYALNVDTHYELNKAIAKKNIQEFSLNTYLIDQLGFKQGINEEIKEYFNKQNVSEWLGEGGQKEDDPLGSWFPATLLPLRATNHFHDPVSDEGWGPGKSAILWALKERNQQYQGYYSWADVRNYFITALTYKDSSMRDIYFAETFRGLGQLMHLVEDMSVPEHTRSQFHAPSEYENYLTDKKRYDKIDITNLNPNFDMALLLSTSGTPSRLPIANLFDTGQYTGKNPDVTNSSDIGLAEYTNANFLCPGTMFTGYDYPSEKTSVQVDNRLTPCRRDPSSTEFVARQYYIKTGDGDKSVYRLANVSFTTEYSNTTTDIYERYPHRAISLDDNVFQEYAAKLIPKAGGYASGILYYFFRGRLEIERPARYVYSIADGSVIPQQFTYIKAKVRNATDYNGGEDPPMGPGKLWAIAKYKKLKNYDPNLAKDPPGAGDRETEFSYSVSAPSDQVNLSLDFQEFEFNFSDDPIPAGITDLYLQVVYQGTLGNEIDTAVAVAPWKDLNEPTHVVVHNATDRVYVHQDLSTTAQIIAKPNARSYFETCEECSTSNQPACKDCTPCMYPFELTTRLAFGRYVPSEQDEDYDYDVIINNQPAGSYSRVLFLADQASMTLTINRDITDDYPCNNLDSSGYPKTTYPSTYPIGCTVNAEDQMGVFHNTSTLTFRQVHSHYWSANAVVTPLDDSAGIVIAPWPELDEANRVAISINK